MGRRSVMERGMQLVFLLVACASIVAVILICVFMFGNGVPAMLKIGIFDFLTGTDWKPLNEIFGILPMIIGSICDYRCDCLWSAGGAAVCHLYGQILP